MRDGIKSMLKAIFWQCCEVEGRVQRNVLGVGKVGVAGSPPCWKAGQRIPRATGRGLGGLQRRVHHCHINRIDDFRGFK